MGELISKNAALVESSIVLYAAGKLYTFSSMKTSINCATHAVTVP